MTSERLPKTISEYEAEGYEGTDECLATSIFEYHLMWKLDKKENEYIFIYPIEFEDDRYPILFDWSQVGADINFWSEYDWADKKSVLSFVGMSEEEFDKNSLPQKINDLEGYYGTENVFGSSHSGGFKIIDNINGENDDCNEK